MSDLEDPADVPVETAQDAVEPNEPSSTESPAPWGEDFDKDRAWRTITHLRDREKELEPQAKQFERLRNDPDAFREFLSEQGYELPEEDDEPEDVEQPTFHDPRVDQLLAEREQERLNQVVMEHAAADVKEIQTEIGRELTPKELEKLGKLAIPDDKGIPRVSLAWNELKELGLGKADPAKVPSPPPTGTQGSEKFDIRNEDQRTARFIAAMERHESS